MPRTIGGQTSENALLELIGKPALVKLAEAFGGMRLYIPEKYLQASEIVEAVGHDVARVLSDAYGRDVIKVPLCREFIAESCRAQGMSNAQIARRLKITESGVERMLKRMGATAPA